MKIVDIFSATDVSDQILGCLMLHAPQLEEFFASYAGGYGVSHILTGHMVAAFKAYYPAAREIYICNLVKDSLI